MKAWLEFYNSWNQYWEKHPALYYGLIFFLGYLYVLQTPWSILPFFFLLNKQHFFKTTLLFLLPSCMVYQLYVFPPTGATIEGTFHIDHIKENERYSGGWNYKGRLKCKEGKIVCYCFSKHFFSPYKTYVIKGKVRATAGSSYILKTQEPWIPSSGRLSLALWRYKAQQFSKKYIQEHFHHSRTANFLIGMVMGQMDDPLLKSEFRQLGLMHLVAISGLHFSLLACIFQLFLRQFFAYKTESICLIFLLTLYLLFVGDTPSVVRSWIMAITFLIGQIIEKRSSSLNTLGVAMLCLLIYDPLSATSLSFQLSFLATAGILCFYAPCEYVLKLWLPKVSLQKAIHQHWLWQYCYIASSLIRQSLALTLAVHIALLPLLLKTFHVIQLNSFIYNLFFPFLASIALILFLVGIPLGNWVHRLNGYYCEWILGLSQDPPLLFKSFYLENISSGICTMIFSLLFAIAMGLKIYLVRKNRSTDTFKGINFL